MQTKTFEVKRMTNGLGHSNLLVIITEAIPDMVIGEALQCPFLDGYKDPIRVKVLVEENGALIKTHLNSVVVTEYVYE